MAGDDGRCWVAVAVVLRAGRQNNQDLRENNQEYELRYSRFLLRLPPWLRKPSTHSGAKSRASR